MLWNVNLKFMEDDEMKKVACIMTFVGLMVLWGINPAFANGLDGSNADDIFDACVETAEATAAAFRTLTTKMWCAVVDREGKLLLIKNTDEGGTPEKPKGSDAWRGSIEIAIAKAYTGLAFSTNELALTSRVIGLVARRDGPGSTVPADIGTNAGVASLFDIGNSNLYRPLKGKVKDDDRLGRQHHGIILFAGGVPVYSNVTGPTDGTCVTGGGVLLGAVGVSGDGVDEDETVAIGAIQGAGFCTEP